MRALLPLAVLMLAACDPPLEELYPARFYTFERDKVTWLGRAQYDPFERGWFVRITALERPLLEEDFERALSLAETGVGPLVCEGGMLDVEPGEVWNPLAGGQITFMPSLGAWQMVGRCTDAPAPPAIVAVFPQPEGDVTTVVVVQDDEE